jgi:hypothetical protein
MQKVAFPNLPPFLVGAPKAVLKRLDPERALLFALNARNEPASPGCLIALSSIDSALAAAKVQQRRIANAKRLMARDWAAGRSIRILFHDVHFYLICWSRVAKLAQFVVRITQYPQARFVLKRYRTRLNEMVAFRDHLEHFEERLPGGLKQHISRVPGDLFNIRGDSATIGGDSVDVGPASLKLLAEIVGEFRSGVLFDALESLAARDPASAVRLIQTAARDVGLSRIMRQVRRDLQSRGAE